MRYKYSSKINLFTLDIDDSLLDDVMVVVTGTQ